MTMADEDATAAGPAPAPEPQPEAPQRESLVDAIADLLQMAVNWLRAEAADIVRDKVVLPVQQLGMTLASAVAAAILLVIGLVFIFVAVLMVLAKWITWPGAFGLVGGLIVAGAGIFTYLKVRSVQK
jgi:hypothetical protein